MNHTIKEAAMDLFGAVRAYPAPATPYERVADLVRRLRPFKAPQGLIRIGPDGDGGYLVPDDLDGISACLSPGVSTVSEFEYACADRGIPCFLADRSVDGPSIDHRLFSFEKRHVGAMTNSDTMTLDDWVDLRMPADGDDLLLQMDIEGDEYESILSMSPRLLRRVRIAVIEFHGLQDLWNRPWFNLVAPAFDKLLHGHACVHIHPNNCYPAFRCRGLSIPCVAEFTFLRRDRLGGRVPPLATEFPHPLDRDNTDADPVILPREWHG